MKRTSFLGCSVGFVWGFLWGELPHLTMRNFLHRNPTASYDGDAKLDKRKKLLTDRGLKAWLANGATDHAVGEGLTFVASAKSAREGKASWILRFRVHGRSREKVLGRYPELTLKQAREQARKDRALIERGVDVAAAKQVEKAKLGEVPTVRDLGQLWYERYIEPRYKHPSVVARVLKKHIYPVIGALTPKDVQPMHVDRVLMRIVANGAPTVANDALLYLNRMFKMAVRNHWIERNPAADFELADAGGPEVPRERALAVEEIEQLASSMRDTPNFGRINELAVWLLLALCVRKMELLSARWDAFDLEAGIWTLQKERTKTKTAIVIPLADTVLEWLKEVRVLSCGSLHVFPARRLVRSRLGQPKVNRFPHVGPDTLNVALKRLEVLDIEHFTVHDMRRTARTNMARLGVDRFVAERALNHKLKNVEGIYDRHDYFSERLTALQAWARLLDSIANTPTGPTTRVGRGARSGEFIPVTEAGRRPGTTTIETVPRRK
ncbi:tyrosine-type recombinase/integrase [Roseateles sp. NT4]|uniref:tyrosine-type recombinase/integrase n=1 Tax=Roseateles sp. NT4 TaxID=3453715 RepID=UPI003EE899B2